MHFAVHGERVPLFLALLPVLALALVMLAADPAFHLTKEAARGFGWRTALSILLVFAIAGGAVAAWVLPHTPGLVHGISEAPAARHSSASCCSIH